MQYWVEYHMILQNICRKLTSAMSAFQRFQNAVKQIVIQFRTTYRTLTRLHGSFRCQRFKQISDLIQQKHLSSFREPVCIVKHKNKYIGIQFQFLTQSSISLWYTSPNTFRTSLSVASAVCGNIKVIKLFFFFFLE